MNPYDLIIRNGRIVDGTGNPWFYSDVAIREDRIVQIGRIDPAGARRQIDAGGLVVAPGFIDMLGHSEITLLVDPRAESKLHQGITTEVTGEGHSVAPVGEGQIPGFIQGATIRRLNVAVDWHTLSGYFRRLEREQPAISLATYVGAGQVRECVLGQEDRPPTAAELAQMERLVAQAMEEGAVGISSALVYAPGSYARTDELIALARVAASYGGLYASHIRGEQEGIVEALEEAIRIGQEACIPVEIFHLKMAGRQNWGRMAEVIRTIETARARGIDITADQYPYTAGATYLAACIPGWAHEGGTDRLLERLKDPATRAMLKQEIRTSSNSSWENFYRAAGGGDRIVLIGAPNPETERFKGRRLSEAARMLGTADELDALFDLVILASGAWMSALFFIMSEDDVKLALQQPWVSVGIDHPAVATTGPLAGSKGHPRGWGSFPRILGQYVRDERLLSLEEAIRKMTSLPANRAHLTGRGLLRPGCYADIAIFDPEQIRDTATYEEPNQLAAGMRHVLVNGRLALEHGRLTGARPGRPLLGPGYQAGRG